MRYGLVGLLLAAICLGALAFHYHGMYTAAQGAITNTEEITKNALAAVDLMRDISKAAHDEKQKLTEEGEARVVYIREAVKSDECATRLVADTATDNLRMLENAARTGLPTKIEP